MFKSIKYKLITIFILFLTLSLFFISFLILSLNFYFSKNSTQNNSNTYVITVKKDSILSERTYVDNIDSLKHYQSKYFTQLVGKIIPIIIIVSILIILISFLFLRRSFEEVIEKKIKRGEEIPELSHYTKVIKDKENLLSASEADVHIINKFIAHEIKNSLAILKGKIEINSDDQIEYIDTINKQIEDISTLTTTKVDKLYEVDLLLLVAECIDLYPEYKIKLNFSEDDNFEILGKKSLLQRAICNIIENAFKYGAQNMEIELNILENNIICILSNDGTQINDEELDKIFNINYRINRLKSNGNGIGLSLVKNVVTLMGGSLFVESCKDKTSFYLSFKQIKD